MGTTVRTTVHHRGTPPATNMSIIREIHQKSEKIHQNVVVFDEAVVVTVVSLAVSAVSLAVSDSFDSSDLKREPLLLI